ncbi:hypothetical protein Tco_1439277 [Tanacetum coccineum]
MANLFPNDDANALVPNFNIGFVPNPGHAHFANNNNNNGWIEWDVPLGEMDEPMVYKLRDRKGRWLDYSKLCRQLYMNPDDKPQLADYVAEISKIVRVTVMQYMAKDGRGLTG